VLIELFFAPITDHQSPMVKVTDVGINRKLVRGVFKKFCNLVP